MKNQIFKSLDKIEELTGKMAHELPGISERLKLWQDGQIKDSFFKLALENYKNELVCKEIGALDA